VPLLRPYAGAGERAYNALHDRSLADLRREASRMSGLRTSLLSREVLPFYFSLAALGGATLAIDAGLHLVNAVWIGRYLGIPGVLLILASSGYSMRKCKLIKAGKPVNLLRWHERLAWAGSLLILVHAGIHFNAILAWLAVGAMLINVASGLTGKYLLGRSRKRLEANRTLLRAQGLSAAALEEQTYWDSLTFDLVKAWRAVHLPITLAFGVLALAHIIATCLFWGWR
jgi:hypothetical protein